MDRGSDCVTKRGIENESAGDRERTVRQRESEREKTREVERSRERERERERFIVRAIPERFSPVSHD